MHHTLDREYSRSENTFNSPTRDLSKLNWHYVTGMTRQPVHLGPNPNLHRQNRLPQPRNGTHSRMATSSQLSIHLPIHPKKGLLKNPLLNHQCAVRLSYPLASGQTQIHSQLVRQVLTSSGFQNRLELWTIIHALGSQIPRQDSSKRRCFDPMMVGLLCAMLFVDWPTTPKNLFAPCP